jgi:hypothetical protein
MSLNLKYFEASIILLTRFNCVSEEQYTVEHSLKEYKYANKLYHCNICQNNWIKIKIKHTHTYGYGYQRLFPQEQSKCKTDHTGTEYI